MTKIQPTKQCRVCPNIFSKPIHKSYKAWELMSCCSKACGATHKSSNGTYQEIVKVCKNTLCNQKFIKAKNNTHKYFLTQEYCSLSCAKFGKHMGENNNKWVGDEIGYQGVHTWIRNKYGKPQFCEKCKRSEPRMYHWANISDKYLRDRDDWKRLCVPCHREFDKNKKLLQPSI